MCSPPLPSHPRALWGNDVVVLSGGAAGAVEAGNEVTTSWAVETAASSDASKPRKPAPDVAKTGDAGAFAPASAGDTKPASWPWGAAKPVLALSCPGDGVDVAVPSCCCCCRSSGDGLGGGVSKAAPLSTGSVA